MVKVVIFFGIPGSGKSYIAKNLAKEFNAYFYEADVDFKDEYRVRGKLSKEDGEKVKNEFYDIVISKIKSYLSEYKLVFVATALGKNKFRHKFIKEFKNEITFVLVTPDPNKHLDYVLERELPDTSVSKEELQKDLKIHLENKILTFEIPDFKYIELENDYSNEATQRSRELLSKHINGIVV